MCVNQAAERNSGDCAELHGRAGAHRDHELCATAARRRRWLYEHWIRNTVQMDGVDERREQEEEEEGAASDHVDDVSAAESDGEDVCE